MLPPGTITFSEIKHIVVRDQLVIQPFFVKLILGDEYQDNTPTTLDMIGLCLRQANQYRRPGHPAAMVCVVGNMAFIGSWAASMTARPSFSGVSTCAC